MGSGGRFRSTSVLGSAPLPLCFSRSFGGDPLDGVRMKGVTRFCLQWGAMYKESVVASYIIEDHLDNQEVSAEMANAVAFSDLTS